MSNSVTPLMMSWAQIPGRQRGGVLLNIQVFIELNFFTLAFFSVCKLFYFRQRIQLPHTDVDLGLHWTYNTAPLRFNQRQF